MNRFSVTVLVLSAALLGSAIQAFGQDRVSAEPLHVSLGEHFTLHEKQSAVLDAEDLRVTVLRFYNTPCPDGANCVWSGVGILFEYRHGQAVQRGIDLVAAFGYRTVVGRTDYERFVDLTIEKP